MAVATHGRSFWILDDLTVLHQYKDDITDKTAHIFAPRRVERHLPKVFDGIFESGDGKQYMSTLGSVAPYLVEETPEHGRKETWLDSGVNPPKGAVITYYLREEPDATISLRIDDSEGNEVKTFKSTHADEEEKAAGLRDDDTPKELRIPTKGRLEPLCLGPALSRCPQGHPA